MQSSMIKSITEDFGNGGIIDGDLTISGDLQVSGGGSLSFDEIIQGTQVIDVTNTEALLVRKNDDGGDVFVVDTTNSKVTVSGSLGVGASPVSSFPAQNVTIEGATAGLVLRDTTGSNQATQFFTLYSSNGDIIGMFDDSKSLKFGHADDAVGTNYEDVLVITSDNRVGIGTDSPGFDLEIADSGTNSQATMAVTGYNDQTGYRPEIQLRKSNSDTLGSVSATPTGTQLGMIRFRGVDSGNGFDDGAIITATQNGGANTKVPTDLKFETSADTSTNSNQLVLHHDGGIGIGTSSPSGILSIFRDDSSTVGTNDVVIENDGSGDASLKFVLTGATEWFAYVDNSDSDKFKIRRSTTDHFSINESGKISVGTGAVYGQATIGGSGEVLSLRSSSGASELHFYEGGTTRGVISSLNGSDGIALKSGTTERMIIDTNSRISLSNNDSGTSNTIFGYKAGNAITTGHNNVVMGHNALLNSQDIGFAVAIGNSAMASGTMTDAADGTVAIGKSALTNLTTGSNNVAVGANALDELSTGGYNTAIGVNALHQVDNGESENVAIGYNAGSNLDGDGGTASGNVCIGSNAIPSSSGGFNQIVIGKDTIGVANNSVNIGNSSITDNYFNGNITASKNSNVFLNLTATGGGARIKLTGQANETTNGLQFYEASNIKASINVNHSTDDMEFRTYSSGAIGTSVALTIDSSQNATFEGSIEGIYIESFSHNFTADINTDNVYIPWQGTVESSSMGTSFTAFLTPFAMELVSFHIRPETITTSDKVNIQMYKQADGTTTRTDIGSANTLSLTTNTVNVVQASTFDILPTVSANEKVGIKIQAPQDLGGEIDWYITTVWKVTKNI